MLFYFKGTELKMVDLNLNNALRQEFEIFVNKGKINKNPHGCALYKLNILNPVTMNE